MNKKQDTVQQMFHKSLQIMKLVNVGIFPTSMKCQVALENPSSDLQNPQILHVH